MLNLLNEWMNLKATHIDYPKMSSQTENALVDFALWLDARATTLRAPVQSEQKCPFCLGSGFTENRGTPYTCDMCNGTGISKRSDGG